MGDFASVIGSGPILGLDDIPNNLSAYYKIVSANVTLDLSKHTGNDVIDGHENIFGMSVTTGSGNDYDFGSWGDDVLSSGKGADTVYGYVGDDSLSGGDGNDLIYGGLGADTVSGDKGDDWVYGNEGDDSLG